MKKKYIHIAIIILGVIFLMLGAFHTNIWFDESYTVAMLNHSFSEIWEIGSKDVHPILYYYMLKFVNLIFGTNIIVYRLFSIVPMAILAVLGFTHIRKNFGENTGIIFSFLVLFMPGLTRYSLEIRMYSWAMLFIAITAIYAYRLYKEKFELKNLIIFGIFSLAGAYTHYYGLMASGLINLGLFIYFLKNYKDKKNELIKFIICAVIQVALYVPWLLIFISQVSSISANGFWITLSFPGTLVEVLSMQMAGAYINRYVALTIMLIIYAYVIFGIYKSIKEKHEIRPAILAIIIYIGVTLAAYIISKIMRPILIDRYLLVVTGLLFFFIAFFMAKANNKYITGLICVVILGFSIYNNIKIIKTNYNKSNDEMLSYIDENIEEGDSFLLYSDEISGFAITVKHQGHMQYFHDNWNWGAGGAYECFSPNFVRDSSLDNIMENASGRIWIINISEKDFEELIQSKYDVSLIERKEFQTAYNGYFFSLTLIEK